MELIYGVSIAFAIIGGVLISGVINDGEKKKEIVIFHGGCHDCTQQFIQPAGVDFCVQCQYFDADWDLPDLNNRDLDDADAIRDEVKRRNK